MKSAEKFIIAKDTDDFATLKKLILEDWKDEYIELASNNQDVLVDIVENRPSKFYSIIHLLNGEHLIYCIKYMDVDYLELYEFLKKYEFTISWNYENGILKLIKINYKNYEYKIEMYEDCVQPSLLKILTYAFNHKVFATFIQNHHNNLFR